MCYAQAGNAVQMEFTGAYTCTVYMYVAHLEYGYLHPANSIAKFNTIHWQHAGQASTRKLGESAILQAHT